MAKTMCVLLFWTGLLACSRSDAVDRGDTRGLPSASRLPTRGLAAGTTLVATIQQPLSSRSDSAGEAVHAIVSLNVMDGDRHTVIPGGAAVMLTITRLSSAATLDALDGVIALDLQSMS